MKKMTSEQMVSVEGGQVELTLIQGDISSYSNFQYNSGGISPLHYSWLDCVGFAGSLGGLGLAAAATGGIAIFGGLLALGTLAASAGDCEGWLNGN